MFSLENFYYILYSNLLKPANLTIFYFSKFGSTSQKDLIAHFVYPYKMESKHIHLSFFWDQEPLLKKNFTKISHVTLESTKSCKLLVTSEHSQDLKQICKSENYISWYYFFHGFAALAWYRDYKYLPLVDHQFSKVFICLNRLVTKDRSYRLLLVSHLLDKNLIEHGITSLHLQDSGYGTWQEELNYPDTKLPRHKINFIREKIGSLKDSLIADIANPKGDFSAHAGPEEYELNQKALWHIVSETVFYYDKLHLTEKIFKPIVSRRPFILVAAPGNLAYLKSYGFKTFDKWIDESYDNEPDHAKRIEMIVGEIEKLCKLDMQQLRNMHEEMKEILNYNFNHLFGNFKNIIIDELVDNFESAIAQWNCNRLDDNFVDISKLDLPGVKALLKH